MDRRRLVINDHLGGGVDGVGGAGIEWETGGQTDERMDRPMNGQVDGPMDGQSFS